MNSLEFINEEIKYWQKTINTLRSEKLTQTIIASLNPLYKVENATLSDSHILSIEKKLTHLQQIKTELEAWEVMKKHLEYFPDDYWNGVTEEIITMTSEIDKKDYPIIKKALEVEDE